MPDDDDDLPDVPLSEEEEARLSSLTPADLARIDNHLLSEASHSWQKVARVIGYTMRAIHEDFPGIPDVIYARRLKHLVKSGALESAGNLDRMRYSEVRLPATDPDSE